MVTDTTYRCTEEIVWAHPKTPARNHDRHWVGDNASESESRFQVLVVSRNSLQNDATHISRAPSTNIQVSQCRSWMWSKPIV